MPDINIVVSKPRADLEEMERMTIKPYKNSETQTSQTSSKEGGGSNKILKSLAIGMMAFGEGMTGRPFYSSYLKTQSDDAQAQMAMQKWQSEQEYQRPLREAQTKYYDAIAANPFMSGSEIPSNMEITGYDPKGRPLVRKSEEVKAKEVASRQAMKNYQAYLPDAQKVLSSLDELEKASVDLGDFNRGVMGQISGRARMAVGDFTKSDKNINKYMSVVSEKLIPLARKLMEEKGPITEWDVARVEKALGDKTLPLEDKLEIINRMRTSVNEAVNYKKSLINTDTNSDFASMSDEELRKIAGQ